MIEVLDEDEDEIGGRRKRRRAASKAQTKFLDSDSDEDGDDELAKNEKDDEDFKIGKIVKLCILHESLSLFITISWKS